MTANTENVNAWLTALRSGEYEQAKGYLETEEGFCCLGVACDVALKAGVNVVREVDDYGRVSYDGAALTLPESVAEWLGFKRAEPRMGGDSLTYLNDHLNKTFSQIADHIEKFDMTEDPINEFLEG